MLQPLYSGTMHVVLKDALQRVKLPSHHDNFTWQSDKTVPTAKQSHITKAACRPTCGHEGTMINLICLQMSGRMPLLFQRNLYLPLKGRDCAAIPCYNLCTVAPGTKSLQRSFLKRIEKYINITPHPHFIQMLNNWV